MTRKRNDAFCFPVTANSLVALHACTLHLSIVGCHKNVFYHLELEVLQHLKLLQSMGNLHTHIVNLLTTNDAFCHGLSDFGGHMLSVRFCTIRKGGIGEGGQVSAQGSYRAHCSCLGW